MNETYDYDGRTYLKPEVDRDERLEFVDNLRKIKNDEVSRIGQDTYNLGTQVPSNLGGLNGASGVWEQQHVNPATNSLVSQLKTTAQASALNTALNNLQAQYKKQYNDAYLAAKKRERNRNNNNIVNPDSVVPEGTVNENGYSTDDLTTVSNDKPKTTNGGPTERADANMNHASDIHDVFTGANTPNSRVPRRDFRVVAPNGAETTMRVYKPNESLDSFVVDGPFTSTGGNYERTRDSINHLIKNGYHIYNGGKEINTTDIFMMEYF